MKNPKIVISGYYGFKNAGDEAMLTAILGSLRHSFPQPDITVISGNPKLTAEVHEVRSIHRFAFWQIFQSLRKADLFISGGGSLLQDITSWQSLLYYLIIIAMGQLTAKRAMLYAQGIGPIRRHWLRWLTAQVLGRLPVLAVRDGESQEFLTELGICKSKIRLTADAVFLLPAADRQDGKILLNRYGLGGEAKVLGVAVRSWQGDSYLGALTDALDSLGDAGYKLFLIPFQYPGDLPVARKLQRALRHDAKVLDRECTTEELMSVIGCLDGLVAMRLHALVFAAVMGVPFVALEYDPKVHGFVRAVHGATAGRVEDLTTEKILSAFGEAGESCEELAGLRLLAEVNNSLARDLLAGCE